MIHPLLSVGLFVYMIGARFPIERVERDIFFGIAQSSRYLSR